MKAGRIAVVDYGMGNIHSILKALRIYHPDTIFTSDRSELEKADALVLPGDGAFAAAMRHLRGGPEETLRRHVELKKPLLGVCIGFQILFKDSDETHSSESAGEIVPGLGILPGKIRRFTFADSSLRVPHMGWNSLVKTAGSFANLENHYVYFIHSYRAVDVPEKNVAAWCRYGNDTFPAAVEKDGTLAVQFHPEKSDKVGLSIIEKWIQAA